VWFQKSVRFNEGLQTRERDVEVKRARAVGMILVVLAGAGGRAWWIRGLRAPAWMGMPGIDTAACGDTRYDHDLITRGSSFGVVHDLTSVGSA
jgi:hypothetical protein